MTLARDGLREIALLSMVLGGATALLAIWFWPAAPLTGLLWIAGLAFFRVPNRAIPQGVGLLVSPADGRVTDVVRLDHDENVGGPALRIGIFLSVFDVHANYAPCAGRVLRADYRRGAFHDARNPQAGPQNEANTIVLAPEPPLPGPVVVRQIAGYVARRIVCRLSAGRNVARGERFGLIKFGSRTELIVPADAGLEPLVAVGDRVRGGATVLMRLQSTTEESKGDHAHHRRPRQPTPAA
jgi:phosphatidylserine decarboxylase